MVIGAVSIFGLPTTLRENMGQRRLEAAEKRFTPK